MDEIERRRREARGPSTPPGGVPGYTIGMCLGGPLAGQVLQVKGKRPEWRIPAPVPLASTWGRGDEPAMLEFVYRLETLTFDHMRAYRFWVPSDWSHVGGLQHDPMVGLAATFALIDADPEQAARCRIR